MNFQKKNNSFTKSSLISIIIAMFMFVGLSVQVIAQDSVLVKVVNESDEDTIVAAPDSDVNIYVRLDNVEFYIDPETGSTIQAIQFEFTYPSDVLEIEYTTDPETGQNIPAVTAFDVTAGDGVNLLPWPVYAGFVDNTPGNPINIGLAMNPVDAGWEDWDPGWYDADPPGDPPDFPIPPGEWPVNPDEIVYLLASGKIVEISAHVKADVEPGDYPDSLVIDEILQEEITPEEAIVPLAILNEYDYDPIPYEEPFPGTLRVESELPTVISKEPDDGAVDVPVDTNITVEFSEPMDTANTETAFSLDTVVGTFSWSAGDTILTFDPTDDLLSETTYNATITGDATDKDGNPLQDAPVEWSFTTEDITPPTVISKDPDDGAVDVPVGTNITVTFSEPMDTANTETAFSLDSVVGAFSWSAGDTILTFDPTDDLLSETIYNATITGDATDKDGNPLQDAPVEWSFTTEDITSPTVISKDPDDGDENVPVGTNITVTFSEPMNTANTEFAFSLDSVVGTFSWSAGDTILTFDPDDDLLPETTYAAAITDAATDKTGNPLQDAPVEWSFTTGVPIEVATITATSDDGEVTPIVLEFGTDPDSTEGFDPDKDIALPPIAPGAKLDAAFKIPPTIVQEISPEAIDRLFRDIRPNTDPVEWRLDVQDLHDPPWMGFCLNWGDLDKVMPPEDKQYISWQLQELDFVTEEPTGDPIDMIATTEACFEASIFGGLRKFTITARSIVIQSLDVAAEWNMASLIGHPINPTVGSVFSPPDIIVETNTYWYDPAVGGYVIIDQFEYTKGYWILALQEATVTTEVTPETEFTINLSAEWNMVGMVGPAGSTIDFTDPDDDPDGSVVGTNTYWYDPAVGGYVITTTLESGKSYWVLALQDCTLTIGPATTASPPSTTPSVLKPDWIMPLELSDSRGVTQSLTVGMSDNTVPNIDFRFDLVSPPVSPASKFNGYISADHQRFNRLDRDIKPISRSASWDIIVDAPGEEVTLSWHPADLPGDKNAVLKIESKTVDMQTTNSIQIPAGKNTVKLIVDTSSKPQELVLMPNWPNPFNPETWIPYKLPKNADVVITIYDALGRPIRKLDLAHKSAGAYIDKAHAAYWDGRNEVGESVASGLYFYTIRAGKLSATRKMFLLK